MLGTKMENPWPRPALPLSRGRKACDYQENLHACRRYSFQLLIKVQAQIIKPVRPVCGNLIRQLAHGLNLHLGLNFL